MNKSKYSNLIAFWLVGLALLLGVYAFELQGVFSKKLSRQESITRNVSQVKATYDALKPTISTWNHTFTSSDDVNSIITLYKALNIGSSGLISSSSDFVEGSIGTVLYQGSDLGLLKRCIKNAGAGFIVESNSLVNLLNGIERLEARKDIEWSTLSISAKNERPQALFDELCVHLRVTEN